MINIARVSYVLEYFARCDKQTCLNICALHYYSKFLFKNTSEEKNYYVTMSGSLTTDTETMQRYKDELQALKTK